MMDMMTGMGLWMLLWGLIGIALLTVLVLCIAWLIRSLLDGQPHPTHPTEGTAHEQYHRGDQDPHPG